MENEIKKNGSEKMAKASIDLNAKFQELKEEASKSSASKSILFITTVSRYQRQIKMLEDLEKAMDEGMLVKKEYVKGRKNVYANPAVAEYNKTADSANKTVATLLKILKTFQKNDDSSEDNDEEDPLLKLINGSDADGSD